MMSASSNIDFLTGTSIEDLAHDHLQYVGRFDVGAFQRRQNCDLTQLMGRQAVITASKVL